MKIASKLFVLSLFVAGHSYAAVTIPVTTFNDENGENSANCSLREAITAVNTKKAFGGCRASDLYLENIIQLDSGTYVLTQGEIVVQRDVTINGANPLDGKTKDSITGGRKRLRPHSEISGNGHRIFNTVYSAADMIVNNVVLANGNADKGGAIIAGGGIAFNNVVARNNQASIAGGVLYLEGNNTTASINNSTLEKNTGATGAVLAMSCIHRLTATKHIVNFISSSIINNGADSNKSIIENCGSIGLDINTSTIAKNTAHADGGIINFNTNTAPDSTFITGRSTLMENNIAPVLLYSNLRAITFTASVLAFNNGKGCKQQGADVTSFNGSSNVFQGVFASCPTFNNDKSTSTNLDPISDASLSNEFTPLGDYGGLTLTYLPKNSSKYVLNKGAGFCVQAQDQRGSDNTYVPDIVCDIGSVERRTPTTIYDRSAIFTNKANAGRVIKLNVLDNDMPGETDNTEDIANARGAFKKDANGKYIIELTQGKEFCSVDYTDSTDNILPIIKFDTGGQVTLTGDEKTCKYRFMDTNGQYSNEADLKLRIDNFPPEAGNDSFILPSGSDTITLPVLDNDNDNGDGIYGGLCTANDSLCNGVYIHISTPPKNGVITAEKTGLCPNIKSNDTKVCVGGTLTYRPNNSLAPFNDSFAYEVYDRDKTASNTATVTITNQVGNDEANAKAGTIANAGSLGGFSLLALSAFAVYRRLRKTHVV